MVMPRSPLLSAFIHCLRTAFSVSLDLGSLGPSGQHVRILPWVAEHLFLRQQLSLFQERKTIMATERPGCQLTVAEAILRGRERARQAFGWLTIESKSCDMTGPSRHCAPGGINLGNFAQAPTKFTSGPNTGLYSGGFGTPVTPLNGSATGQRAGTIVACFQF